MNFRGNMHKLFLSNNFYSDFQVHSHDKESSFADKCKYVNLVCKQVNDLHFSLPKLFGGTVKAAILDSHIK